ncbi:MAG: pyridoxamine 5'-phosphate oxidase family protein [Paracoccaceae bacterium]
MQPITDIAILEVHYGQVSPRSITKVAQQVTPLYRKWIDAARFVILSTVGPEGTDASPRGDDGTVVRIADDRTLLLPDWMGNNRLDSLRNIIRDNRVSLMFMVPGSTNVVRVNGTAIVTADADLRASFERKGRRPATITVIRTQELYFQCAKAIMRSRLWTSDDESKGLPTAGQFLREAEDGFDAETYDQTYPEYAKDRMW